MQHGVGASLYVLTIMASWIARLENSSATWLAHESSARYTRRLLIVCLLSQLHLVLVTSGSASCYICLWLLWNLVLVLWNLVLVLLNLVRAFVQFVSRCNIWFMLWWNFLLVCGLWFLVSWNSVPVLVNFGYNSCEIWFWCLCIWFLFLRNLASNSCEVFYRFCEIWFKYLLYSVGILTRFGSSTC